MWTDAKAINFVIEQAGGVLAAARLLGLKSSPALRNWLDRGIAPRERFRF